MATTEWPQPPYNEIVAVCQGFLDENLVERATGIEPV